MQESTLRIRRKVIQAINLKIKVTQIRTLRESEDLLRGR